MTIRPRGNHESNVQEMHIALILCGDTLSTNTFYQFKPNVFVHRYELEQSISVFVERYFSILFKFSNVRSKAVVLLLLIDCYFHCGIL